MMNNFCDMFIPEQSQNNNNLINNNLYNWSFLNNSMPSINSNLMNLNNMNNNLMMNNRMMNSRMMNNPMMNNTMLIPMMNSTMMNNPMMNNNLQLNHPFFNNNTMIPNPFYFNNCFPNMNMMTFPNSFPHMNNMMNLNNINFFDINRANNNNNNQNHNDDKLKKQFIKELDEYQYKNKDKFDNSLIEDECSICLCNYKITDLLKILPCKHGFHKKCIKKWLSNDEHNKCPLCNFDIKAEINKRKADLEKNINDAEIENN